MLGTVLLTAEATIATTDAVLLACVLGVQGVLLRLYRAAREPDFSPPRNRTVMWGWAALGFGILIKGPVILAVAAAALVGLTAWDWWQARRNRKPDSPAAEAAWSWLMPFPSTMRCGLTTNGNKGWAPGSVGLIPVVIRV